MRKKLGILLLLLSGTFALSLPSIAADESKSEQKIAIVDMQKVFNNYEKTKLIEELLNKQMETFKSYSKMMNASLQNLKKEYVALRDDAQNIALSEAERKNKEMKALEKYNQVASKENEIAAYNRESQQKIKELFDAKRVEIIAEISKTVQAQAIASGYTLVLDKSGDSLNAITVVVYYAPGIDITERVIEDVNRAYRKSIKKADGNTPAK